MNSHTSHQTLLRTPLSLLSYKRASSERYSFHQGLSQTQTHSHTQIHRGFGGDFLLYLWRNLNLHTFAEWAASKTASCTASLAKTTERPFCKMLTVRVHLPKTLEGALAKANSAFSEGVFGVLLNSGSIKVVSRHLTICTHSSKRMHLNIFHAHCLICILTSRNQRVLCSPFQHAQYIYNIISL